MERLIIDTDPGVDDAQALFMAAAHPGARIEAILTVSGNVPLADTARNALTIVELLGQEIPVYAGCDAPFVHSARHATIVHGVDGLGDAGLVPRQRRLEEEHAVLALLRLVRQEPEAFTLVAIGPLTNIATALKIDPALPQRLRRFVVMGGAVTGRGNTPNLSAEFNFFADPEAAHVVFSAWETAGRPLELVDWEATVRHAVPVAVLERWFGLGTPRAAFLEAISSRTLAYISEQFHRDALYAADPLAMAVVLEPGGVRRAERHHVSIETAGGHTRGQTTVDWENRSGRPANASIILDFDQGIFLELFEAAFR